MSSVAYDELNSKSWYAGNIDRLQAETFLRQCDPGRFVIRIAREPNAVTLSHKQVNGDIGHAFIKHSPAGWSLTLGAEGGSDKFFPTVEAVLRSRQLKFPRPGEVGYPGRVESNNGFVVGATNVPSSAPTPASGSYSVASSLPTPPAPFPAIPSPSSLAHDPRSNLSASISTPLPPLPSLPTSSAAPTPYTSVPPPSSTSLNGSRNAISASYGQPPPSLSSYQLNSASGPGTSGSPSPPSPAIAGPSSLSSSGSIAGPSSMAHFDNSEALDRVLACLVNPNLKSLDLMELKLTSLPSEVKDLSMLQNLHLSKNLFQSIPDHVCSLVNLKVLHMPTNLLTALPPEIGHLVNLEKLKLSSNKLNSRSGFPKELSKLKSLREIWLDSNNLDSFPSELLFVTSLTRIWMESNQIADLPVGISQLVQLERLCMNNNLLSVVPAELARCVNLDRLQFDDNFISHVAAELAQCQKLTLLSLANNKIVQMSDFSSLPNLELRLDGNPCLDHSVASTSNGTYNGGQGTPSGSPFDRSNSSSEQQRKASGAGSTPDGKSGSSGSAANGTSGSSGSSTSSSAKVKAPRTTSFFGLFPGRGKDEKEMQALKNVALHAAIKDNDLKEVKNILKQKKKYPVDMGALDADQLTPLNSACKNNCTQIVKEILACPFVTKDEINLKDQKGLSALHWAVRFSDDQIIEALLNYNGIKTDLADSSLATPLHYFCEKNHSPNCEKIGQLLIDKGSLVNAKDSLGFTPLHRAVFNNTVRLIMVRLLIKNNADVNAKTNKGETPLHCAVILRREDLVTALLKAGADMSVRTKDYQTAYEFAVMEKSERIAKLLKDSDDLLNFLKSLNMEQYFTNFLKEQLFMDQLPEITEPLLESIGITAAGHRVKLYRACQDRKALRSASPTDGVVGMEVDQPPQFVLDGEAEKKWMEELMKEGMPLVEGEWIKFEDIELLRELGAGASGKVFEGIYQSKQVAVKVLKELKEEAAIEDFKKELEIMTKIRDPHMVLFYGVCLKPMMCMVMEFCARGSLFHVLNKAGVNVGWSQILEWGAQAAGGTACLHKHNIVHRDLKSLNLLVTDKWAIKVCDFGLARFNSEGNLETLNKMRGTMAYCPPEAYNAAPFDYKSDVYSLSIIIWELVNRCIKGKYEAPFAEFKNLTMDFQIIIQVAKNHLRPTIPPSCPPLMKQLIENTWTFEREKRPTAAELQTKLRELAQKYDANKKAWDDAKAAPPAAAPEAPK